MVGGDVELGGRDGCGLVESCSRQEAAAGFYKHRNHILVSIQR
jgi:hypothetical protein